MLASCFDRLEKSTTYNVRAIFLSSLAARLKGVPASRAKLLACLLHMVPWQGPKAWRGRFAWRHLADVIGMSRPTVRRAVRDLEELRLIRVLRSDRSASLILINTDRLFEGGNSDGEHWWIPRAYRMKAATWAGVGLDELTEEQLVAYLRRDSAIFFVPEPGESEANSARGAGIKDATDSASPQEKKNAEPTTAEPVAGAEDPCGSDATRYQMDPPNLERDHTTHTRSGARSRVEAGTSLHPPTSGASGASTGCAGDGGSPLAPPAHPKAPKAPQVAPAGPREGAATPPVFEGSNLSKSDAADRLSHQRSTARQAVDALAAAHATIAGAGLTAPRSLELQIHRWARIAGAASYSDTERAHLLEHAIRRACEAAIRHQRQEPDMALAEHIIRRPQSADLGRWTWEERQAHRRTKRETARRRWARRRQAEAAAANPGRWDEAARSAVVAHQQQQLAGEVSRWAGVDVDQVNESLVATYFEHLDAELFNQAPSPSTRLPAAVSVDQVATLEAGRSGLLGLLGARCAQAATESRARAAFAEMLAHLR